MAFGITDQTIEEIKARTDLADLIASYGIAVKTAGASKKACCPFHHEKTPSFNINDAKGYYHCFGCGESGDAISFVMKMDGLSFVEAARKLAAQCGVKIEEKADPEGDRRKRLLALMAELAAFYHRCLLKTREAEPARAYLASRDLGPDVQESFLIGYAPNGVAAIRRWAGKHGFTDDELEAAGVIRKPDRPGDAGYHRFAGRIMFSICDKQGRVVAFSGRQLVASKNSGKYVNSPETVIFKKSNVLFGFNKAAGAIAKSPHREAIVCEGQIDTIRLHISGFPVAVASQGTAFTEEHVRMLKRVADQVTLVFDDDAAGHKATIRTAGLFLAAEMPVRVVSLPGGDDPDSFLRTHPAEDFQRMLDSAESIMSFQVRAERAKEKRPDSIDAVSRITKALIATIAQSANAILRASMVSEAARLLNLPERAFAEELEKARTALRAARTVRPAERDADAHGEVDAEDETAGDEVQDATASGDAPAETGVPAASILPPPARELALCELLLANEETPEAATMDGMLGEFLPPEVFVHPFTRQFVDTWRTGVASGASAVVPWCEQLPPTARGWFDRILLGQAKSQASGVEPIQQLQDFVRALWRDALERRRGNLAATGSREDDRMRLKLSVDIKRLATMKWSDVKEYVRNYPS